MILTNNKVIDIYSKIEDIIVRNIINNNVDNSRYFLTKIKNSIIKLNNIGININVELDIKNLEMEFFIYFDNANIYIRTLFNKDDEVLFIHYTDIIYITDNNGVITHDLTKQLILN